MHKSHVSKNYCGVILAAGNGTRMHPFSERYPKPLLPICNKPQIIHQIEIMRELGLTDIFVLIGHRGYEIAKVLGDGSSLNVRIHFVEQTKTLGIAHAVGQLERHLSKPFLLFLGDIYLVPNGLEQVFSIYEQQQGGGILAAREDTPENIRKNFAINIGPDGMVKRVIEKPRHVPNRLKGVGAYLFDLTIFDAIRRTPRTALRDEYELTDSIQVMIEQGNPVRAANVIAEDINLTNPGDLLRCNLLHALTHARENNRGVPLYAHPQASIENSVIGSNVTITHPISITDSVIFDHTEVNINSQLDRVIMTPDLFVDCRYFVDGGNAAQARARAANA